MEESPQRLEQKLTQAIQLGACALVALAVGWWTASAHFLIVIASLFAVGFVVVVGIDVHVAIFGLLLFSQILRIVGIALPLPMGVNEFNIIFAAIIFVLLARYAMTKRWEFRLREKWIGNWLYVYFALIFISAYRGYSNFPYMELVHVDVGVETAKQVFTSQFIKPVMYIGLFFVGYNFSSHIQYRRRYLIAMGCALLFYMMTMVLQYAHLLPVFSRQPGKQAGGVIGSANALGILLALYSVFWMTRTPYFQRGLQFLFPALLLATSAVSMAYTRSRTSWLLAVLGGLLIACTARKWVVRFCGVAVIAVVVITSPLWAPQHLREYWRETTVAQVDDPNAMLSGRVTIWKKAVEYVRRDPKLLVFGGGKFDFLSKGRELGLPTNFFAHHQIVQSLVDEGIVGVLVVLVLFGRILWGLAQGWRRGSSVELKQLSRLLTIVTLLLLISGTQIDDRLSSWFWFLIGMHAALRESESPAAEPAYTTAATRVGQRPAPALVTPMLRAPESRS